MKHDASKTQTVIQTVAQRIKHYLLHILLSSSGPRPEWANN